MTITKKTAEMDIRVKLSTLWIVVAINVAMADIIGITLELMSGAESEFQVSQVAMLIFAVIVEIPIAMIFLSRVLCSRTLHRYLLIPFCVLRLLIIWFITN